MNRADLRRLAKERVMDAKALFLAGRWAGAYYMAGYAVECALKSCIIAHLMKTDLFPEKRFSERCWTHDLEQLVEQAGLQHQKETDMLADRQLAANWGIVEEWDESSRYQRNPKKEARKLYNAITDQQHGVLAWIRSHW
jgi:HEPN domain-containing protein